jgi:hypothetical protein
MKRAILMSSVLLLILGAATPAMAATDKKTCKVNTNDIGTIIGRGSNSDAAFEDAATQCFERRAKLHEIKKGTAIDEEAGLVMIDVCANIRCNS